MAEWSRHSQSPAYRHVIRFQISLAEYRFDYLMLAAQGYQESPLDQSRRKPERRGSNYAGDSEICSGVSH
jgi:hypothetical protein